MRATFTDTKGYRVIVEPINGQSKNELIAKAEQIMRKRNIISKLVIED